MVADRVVRRRGDRVRTALGLPVRADQRRLPGLEHERPRAEIESDEARQGRGRDHGADGKREDVWHGGWPAGRDSGFYVAGSAAGGGA